MGDKDWFNEETGDVLLDIRAGVMGCEQMWNESQQKDTTHNNIMNQARSDPDAVLKKVREQTEPQ